MDVDVWVYIMIFIVQIIGGMLGLAIFVSIYRQNRKKGLACLMLMIIWVIYSMFEGFSGSSKLGAGMIIIYCILFWVAYFHLKRKKHETEDLVR
ncbi:hypothetical protein [Falsibacillus pallidus]|uniref:YesK-like protein n=1 Tax=Falsibacillus pallidus TaxID=493781 RepID=A0A370G5Z1_9BACI|nr:hypothetical protein [Falsibacillus pallidus]RDI39195.1 hypothetical protein DFR59_115102 [Falsibacillus pallidus]